MESTCRLRTHPNYQRLVGLTEESHSRGRASAGISKHDIALARLYSHSFRGHVIGAFHATRIALDAIHPRDRTAVVQLNRAAELLTDLANRSMDPVGDDVRALISTFHHYCTHVARVVNALDAACELEHDAALQRISDCFVRNMEAITTGNGLHLTQDTGSPELGSFVVPSLGITIVPLVYGDYHSWNLAWLDGKRSDVPYHLHREGVEIHLGYPPIHGYTVLGDAKAEVTAGYAMPIPPNTRHGYTNIGNETHHVPFVYGSLTYGGWGVFLDVEPQPRELNDLTSTTLMSNQLNGTVQLDREIAKASMKPSSIRYPIIPAKRTDRGGWEGWNLPWLASPSRAST